VSIRDPDSGSWFIQTLCKVFAEHGRTDHLEDLLKLTSLELAQLKAPYLGKIIVDFTKNSAILLNLLLILLKGTQTSVTELRGFYHHLYFKRET